MSTIDLEGAAALLRPVEDFPIEDITFWDISPLLRDPDAVHLCIKKIAEYWSDAEIDVVAGFDARGFIFGPLLAQALNCSFEQIRKKGKLPGTTVSQSYGLEYRDDVIEMIDDGSIDGKRVLLIDDLLATGGTAFAGCVLVEKLGGTVVGFGSVIELPELGGRAKLLDYPVHSLISIIEKTPIVDIEYCVDMSAEHLEKEATLVFIERLNEPTGIAFPGGRIEKFESPRTAVIRELVEETGYDVFTDLQFVSTLCGLTRDTRGVKVSLLFTTNVSGEHHNGEPGKTCVKHFTKNEIASLPPASFAFDAHEVIRTNVLNREVVGA